jgi:hypothetical protein
LRRLAEPFEALRDAAEASDVEPTVVLVALGPVAGHAERAAFVVNLFEVGGIRVLDGGGSVASATGVVADSGCRLAVVCGSDDPSADEAGELMLAVSEGRWSFERIVGDLSDLVNGREGRINDERITLFKSVGLATWDLLVADLVVDS